MNNFCEILLCCYSLFYYFNCSNFETFAETLSSQCVGGSHLNTKELLMSRSSKGGEGLGRIVVEEVKRFVAYFEKDVYVDNI